MPTVQHNPNHASQQHAPRDDEDPRGGAVFWAIVAIGLLIMAGAIALVVTK